jgi:GGDEF domain-containing protein
MIDEHSLVQVGISFGAANFPEDGRQSDLLLIVADKAMYKNKFKRRQGKNYPAGVVCFDRIVKESS